MVSDPATQKPAGKHRFHSRGDTLKGKTQHQAPQEILALNGIFGASAPRSIAAHSDKMPLVGAAACPPRVAPFSARGAAVRGVKPESAPRAAKCFAPGRAWLCWLRSAPFKAKGEFLQSPPRASLLGGSCPGLGTAAGRWRWPSAPLETGTELCLAYPSAGAHLAGCKGTV